MTEPLRCALVGAGRIAQSYAHALAGCHELRPVAVVDVNAEAARAVARLLGCSACASAEELIATRPGLEAVIVCTPPSTHRNLCGLFVRQGWHVLCEKPFSLDVRSARTMLAAAHKADVLLTMASKFRYVADVIEGAKTGALRVAWRGRPVRERLCLARGHEPALER